MLRAEELEVLVTGTQELDFEELAKATEYDGGFDEDHPTVSAFWRAVAGMPPEEQRRLLMFVTGSKKASDTYLSRFRAGAARDLFRASAVRSIFVRV